MGLDPNKNEPVKYMKKAEMGIETMSLILHKAYYAYWLL